MLLLQVLDGRQTVAEVLGGGHGPLLVDPGHLVTHVPVELEQEVRLLQVVTADLTRLGQRLVPGREGVERCGVTLEREVGLAFFEIT